MRSTILILAAALVCGACTTSGKSDGEMAAESDTSGGNESMATGGSPEMAMNASGMGTAETRARTDRRLQLQRSLDQWWLAVQRQEYAKSDGLGTALEQFVNKHFDEIAEDLTHANPRWRKIAAAGLGFSGRPQAVAPLESALRDSDADVLVGALLSLGRLAEADVTIDATKVTPFLSHSAPDIRSNAALVLVHATKKGQGELYLPLTAAMEDHDAGVRVHVAAALGALGDPGAVPFLIRAMDDEKALVRIRAAYALARIGDQRAIPRLIDAIDDPSIDVSRASHKSLRVLTGQDFERRREAWAAYWNSRQHQGS